MLNFSNISVLKVEDLKREVLAGNFGQEFTGLDGLQYINLRGRSKDGKRQLLKVAVTSEPREMSVTFLKEVGGIQYFSCAATRSESDIAAMATAFGFQTTESAPAETGTRRRRR